MRYECIGGLSRAEVGGVERSVGIERFAVAERDGRAGGSASGQANVADHVLAEIDDPGLAQAGDFLGGKFQQFADRRAKLRIE